MKQRRTIVNVSKHPVDFNDDLVIAFSFLKENYEKHNWTLFLKALDSERGIQFTTGSLAWREAKKWYRNRCHLYKYISRNTYSFEFVSTYRILLRQALSFLDSNQDF